MNSVLVKKAGIFTTIQDRGRIGSRMLGIGPGGPMDPAAASIANALVGNHQAEAYLEVHFPAPRLEFRSSTVIAICGAQLSPMIDDRPVANWQPIIVEKGSSLSFSNRSHGNRAYIAFYGGIDADEWLGSRSTNTKAGFGGHNGRRLVDGDHLMLRRTVPHLNDLRPAAASHSVRSKYSKHPTIRIVPGPEFELLDEDSKHLLFNEKFVLTNDCDRMGARLAGSPLSPTAGSMLSTGVSFGTIQLLPDGSPVVLLADHQVTGGYPRIGQIITVDLGLMGQLGPGDHVSFHRVDIEHAERLLAAWASELNVLTIACRFRSRSWRN